MSHNTREGNGGWIEAPEVVRSKCRAICGENDIDCENEDVFIYRRIEIDTATDMAYQAGLSTLHQELQKARQEERERIKEIVVDQIYAGSKTKSEALHFIEKAIDQSELDQPNK